MDPYKEMYKATLTELQDIQNEIEKVQKILKDSTNNYQVAWGGQDRSRTSGHLAGFTNHDGFAEQSRGQLHRRAKGANAKDGGREQPQEAPSRRWEDTVGNHEAKVGQDTNVSMGVGRHLVSEMPMFQAIENGGGLWCRTPWWGSSWQHSRASWRSGLSVLEVLGIGKCQSSATGHDVFAREAPARLYDIRGKLLNSAMGFAEMVQTKSACWSFSFG